MLLVVQAGIGGHADVVEVLLNANAAVNSTRTDGATPLLMAAQYGWVVIVQQLLAANADPSKVRANRAKRAAPAPPVYCLVGIQKDTFLTIHGAVTWVLTTCWR